MLSGVLTLQLLPKSESCQAFVVVLVHDVDHMACCHLVVGLHDRKTHEC